MELPEIKYMQADGVSSSWTGNIPIYTNEPTPGYGTGTITIQQADVEATFKAILAYLEEKQWQFDNEYARGFNDGAYEQRTLNQKEKLHCEKPLFKAEDIKIRDNFKSEYWVDIDVDYATIDEAEQVREVLLKLTDTHL